MKAAFCITGDFNLGAAYVIAYLKQINYEVRLFFDPYSSMYGSNLLRGIKEYRPDLVCFSCVTATYGWALNLAKECKKSLLSARVIFGGVHPTLCPEDIAKEGFEVCIGDGIKYFGGEFKPDELWADREIFFEQLPPVHRQYQIFMTGFGCPFRCSFCNNHQLHRNLIRRSPEGCIQELSHLKQKGLKYVLFDDDIFTLNQVWLVHFMRAYQKSIFLPFTCFGHSKFITEKIALLLRQSRCQCVWLGVQSGDEKTRKEILNRPETNQEIQNACRIIKQNKLKLMIDHIFGIPTDNYEKLLTSYQFYKTLNPDVVNCYELLYFPKAEINKYGNSQALYQKHGGQDYQRYAKSFAGIPLMVH